VLRSTAERILRTVNTNTDPNRTPLADATFVHKTGMSDSEYKQWLIDHNRADIADSEILEWHKEQQEKRYDDKQLQSDTMYKVLSPVSQLFGSTVHAGLVTLDDATLAKKSVLERTHVAISRFTGGAGRKLLFKEEVLPTATVLSTTLNITNFALWQIGLLALVFQEINRGYVGIGAGTRKGQGQVKITVPVIEFTYNAQAYKNGEKGIISAQARLAEFPWSVKDVPCAVQKTEHDKILLKGIDPQSLQGWREEGLKLLRVEGAQVTTLFQEAVQNVWVPWIDAAIEEGGQHVKESV
jgi:CRISPR/Cas system CSM-associated protein Csm3 (group 7 of RAMP superfamily)